MSVDHETGAMQYLSFRLAGELFAFEISRIREVLDYTRITRVPHTPAFLCGIINLRGNVVPVIDLHSKLAIPQIEKQTNTCIIIVEGMLEEELTVLGALADSVQEVFELNDDQIHPPPALGTGLNTRFIKGIGQLNDEFIMILDLDRIFSAEELAVVQELEEEGI